jgi:hypothetical protein
MFRFRCAIGAAVVLFAALGFGRAQDDTFDLRGPAPQKGQVLVSKSTLKIKDADTVMRAAGEKVELKLTFLVTVEEEAKVLEVDGRNVTKCQIKIARDRTETSASGLNQTEPSVLEKETVISTRDGKKWKHALEGTEPNDKQKKELADRNGIENDDDLYPKEKVKVGHTWTVGAAALNKMMGNSFSDLKGKVDQKFVKVEDLDGEKVAVVESSGKITGKMKDDGEPTIDAELDLKITTWRSLKSGIAVKEKYEGKISLNGTVKEENVKVEMMLTGPLAGEATTKLVEKK